MIKTALKYFLSLSVVAGIGLLYISGTGNDAVACNSLPAVSESGINITSQVDTLIVPTSHIASPAKVVVALPSQALVDDDALYPTVYLLHGYDGDYASWCRNADLGKLADDYGCIIVCPDGRDSWYWDSPKVPDMQMESYIVDDLVPFVDDNLPTIVNPDSRAITGLSMGGHGALWLAMRHPDLFGSAATMSGGVDIVKFPDRWKMKKWLGPYAQNKSSWADHSVMSLVPDLKPGQLNLLLDCGEQDMFYKVNVALDNELTKRGIEHRFIHRPGNHSWKYWRASLPKHLDFFKQHFDSGNNKD